MQFRVLFTGWVLFQCAMVLGAQQPPAKVTVQGVVRDARTDQPIAGARVTLVSLTATPPSASASTSLVTTQIATGRLSWV